MTHEYEHISAVLLSKAKLSHYDRDLGNDFVLVVNPNAKNPILDELMCLCPQVLIYQNLE